jgi:pilus assembly protein CpaB
MNTRRLGLALFAAVVISLGVTSVFYMRIMRQEAKNRAKSKRVVAAAAGLQPGTPLTADNVMEINWPENVPLDGLIEKKEDVTGHVLIYAVAANEPVLKRDLASGTSFGLAAKIPDGMRATAVKTNEDMSVAGFIFPGSRVDVLVTLRADNNNESTLTRTVLQNVQVLSTGAKMDPDPNGKPENVTVVTLLVTPEQSEKLALAENQGTLHFALRNGGDSATPETPTVDMAELKGEPKKVALPQPGKQVPRHVPVVKAPEFYSVEIISGGKSSVSKFPVSPE